MSNIKTWNAESGTAQRFPLSGGPTKRVGAGNCKRIYVGRVDSTYQYFGYLKFTLNWTDVGRIVKAVLTLYADDGNGIQGDTMPDTGEGKVTVKRLSSPFSEGKASEIWASSDGTTPTDVVAGAVTQTAPVTDFTATEFDITDIVGQWAPKTVKQRNGSAGGAAPNHGITTYGTGVKAEHYAYFSEDEAILTQYRPVITLTYDYGLTVPTVPANLAPTGSVASFSDFSGDFNDIDASDTLAYSNVQVYTSAATNSGQTVTGGTKLYDRVQREANNDIIAGAFSHIPDNFVPKRGTTYKWRARVQDQEGQWSLWSNLISFVTTNTAPVAPVLTPTTGSSRASLDGLHFRGTYSDAENNTLDAYEVQMSAYPEGDEHWLDDEFYLWYTGKRFAPSGGTVWDTMYGGQSLDAGTYYWRARHWDNWGGVSEWSYAALTLTADFEVDPATSVNAIQQRSRVPWRIVIRDMGTLRGPGTVVAILEDAANVGASKMLNSPGEAHWTLGANHPQLAVIEPKQTHYAIEFRQGDGWREVYAGLVWDFDATEGDIVFYGIDYLALLDMMVDERYDPRNADKSYTSGGSKYVNVAISDIITNQLTTAKALANSPVGFITNGTIESMASTLTIYSTYSPVLTLIAQLLESNRAGSGKRSRISCEKTAAGGYQWVVEDNAGMNRDNLRLRYGELVQGYRVIGFGKDWATRIAGVGRDKDGVKVRYSNQASLLDESVWGRFTKAQLIDGVNDANDFARRVRQAASSAARLGKSLGLGIRSGFLQPEDGYVVCDRFPVDIEDGSVSTSAFGSGYWAALGVTWVATQKGDSTTTLTLYPVEDDNPPDDDLLVNQPISTQAEWQVGWDPPDVVAATSRYWLDQNTGKVYLRDEDGVRDAIAITGVASTNLITAASAHGFSAGDIVYFPTLSGGASLLTDTGYYVIASGLTTTAFKVSTTLGGSEYNFSSDITAGTVQNAPTYTLVSSGAMTPPSAPATPSAPGLITNVDGFLVRLIVDVGDE